MVEDISKPDGRKNKINALRNLGFSSVSGGGDRKIKKWY